MKKNITIKDLKKIKKKGFLKKKENFTMPWGI